MKQNTLTWAIVLGALVLAVIAVIVTNTVGSGKAVYPITGCVDSDVSRQNKDTRLGLNYYSTGTVKSGRSIYTDYCSAGLLVEYVCSGDRISSTNYNCPNGCVDGRCKDNPYE